MDVLEIRRQNLRKLMRERGANTLSTTLGYRQSSYLSQMAGPNPTRDVTEKTARSYETLLGLPKGSMDQPQVEAPQPTPESVTPAAVPPEDLIAMVLTATRALGRLAEAQSVALPPSKFGNVLAMVIKDATEHGGAVRESYINEVVELLK